jgi:hypothetical protein
VFESCTQLELVVLPAGLTAIKNRAFFGCSKLKRVVIHEDLKKIGAEAFMNCVCLTADSFEITQMEEV